MVWCDDIFRGASARGQLLTAAETGEEAFTNCGRSMREEHAGERSGSLPRTDAAQIRGNLALVAAGGVSERRP